ncbi:LAME_0H05490g1_1 [Lachancea meyersii CBS 8951]|uniref:LAME_0H05490g1_1 n=1 Tax=Lachancea meyersii CBS 8951 TaxID=1266667 RepID=A0A1G4KE80_9SACH|nr:LAME_0H05490g1_1 [Lachancea meyersii CBS 8951]
MFSHLMRSVASCRRVLTHFQSPILVQTRTLMKTHKGTAKRWRKTSTSYKRGRAGRNHGNAGWSRSSLKSLSGKTLAHSTHIKHLKRLLPYQ